MRITSRKEGNKIRKIAGEKEQWGKRRWLNRRSWSLVGGGRKKVSNGIGEPHRLREGQTGSESYKEERDEEGKVCKSGREGRRGI